MLPRIPVVKTAALTKRLIVLHEIFAPLGGKSSGKLFGAIWHESIVGRSAEEVASTYSKIFCQPKIKNIVPLAVICSGQHKNQVLYTMFCYEVNTQAGPNTITVKYFEKCHTFIYFCRFFPLSDRNRDKTNEKCL